MANAFSRIHPRSLNTLAGAGDGRIRPTISGPARRAAMSTSHPVRRKTAPTALQVNIHRRSRNRVNQPGFFFWSRLTAEYAEAPRKAQCGYVSFGGVNSSTVRADSVARSLDEKFIRFRGLR